MGRFRRVVSWALVATLVAPAALPAQTATLPPVADPPESTSKRRANPPLPVSLERIRRELIATTQTTETRDGLKLEYYVDVYGRAPQLELFRREENFTSAPVMYGGMTHQEFLQLVTPEEFRSPPADILGALAALLKLAADKKKKDTPKR